jgi:hypothetical protein
MESIYYTRLGYFTIMSQPIKAEFWKRGVGLIFVKVVKVDRLIELVNFLQTV